jgi:hypothetical protein
MDKKGGGRYTGRRVLVTIKKMRLNGKEQKKYKEEIISVFYNPERLL